MNELHELLSLVGLCDVDEIANPIITESGSAIYLKNGERIISLARQKEKKLSSKDENLTVRLEYLKYPTLETNNYKYEKQIESAISRHIKKELQKESSKEYIENECIPFLLRYISDSETLSIKLLEPSYEKSLAYVVSKSEHILEVTLKNEKFYIPVKPLKRFSDSDYHFRSDKTRNIHMKHCDVFFMPLFLLKWLNDMRVDASQNDDILEYLKKEIKENTFHLLTVNWVDKELPNWFALFLMDNGYTLKDNVYRNLGIKTSKTTTYEEMLKEYPHIIRVVSFVYANRPFTCEEFLHTSSFSTGIKVPYTILTLAFKWLRESIFDFSNRRKEDMYKKSLRGMVARAYTTKRNIPEYIINEMKNSPLNRYFGFIEFDEDVDLKLVDNIVEEFQKLNHYIFHDFQCQDVALRFRKLGKHKATGLYYPSISTLVVDFRYPTSFMHEYFHMIDDHLGNLSQNYSFREIANKYRQIVVKAFEKNEFKLSRSSKYNLDYYLRKSEIFARCGEMYLFHCKKIISSLLKQEEHLVFCYPNDKELYDLIEPYFENLLNTLKSTCNRRAHNERNICIANH